MRKRDKLIVGRFLLKHTRYSPSRRAAVGWMIAVWQPPGSLRTLGLSYDLVLGHRALTRHTSKKPSRPTITWSVHQMHVNRLLLHKPCRRRSA